MPKSHSLRRLVALAALVAGAVASVSLLATIAPAAAADVATFHGQSPARLMETRGGLTTTDGMFNGIGSVVGGRTIDLQVSGRGGIPATGAGAVALNVTVTGPTSDGYVTVFPTGSARPTASTLNYTAGRTVPNMTIVGLGTGGQVSLFNFTGGRSDIVVDVLGWFTSVGAFTGVNPARLLETRAGLTTVDGVSASGGALTAMTTRNVTVLSRGTIPATGVGAVALNVTATGPTRAGFLTVFPTGVTRPTASNLNFVTGLTVANLVIVPVGASGQVSVYNGSDGNVDVVVDVLGWFPTGSTFTGLTPTRMLDTRAATTTTDGRFNGNGAVVGGTTFNLVVNGRGGVPAAGTGAVALNVTVTGPTTDGFVTVYPAGRVRPAASNLNFTPGQTVANMVIVPIGTAGQVSIYNSVGNTNVIVDVLGWFPNPTDPATVYGNNLTLRSNGIGTMTFGSTPAGTIALVQVVLGPPVSDRNWSFPFAGTGYFYNNDDDAFDQPFARTVCFASSLCAVFGGATAGALTLLGWNYFSDNAGLLFDAAGVSLGSRANDFAPNIVYSAGGCFTYSSGNSTTGVMLDLFSRGLPFSTVDAAGNYVPVLPAASDVFVVGMWAGSQISNLNADC